MLTEGLDVDLMNQSVLNQQRDQFEKNLAYLHLLNDNPIIQKNVFNRG